MSDRETGREKEREGKNRERGEIRRGCGGGGLRYYGVEGLKRNKCDISYNNIMFKTRDGARPL